MANKKYQRGEDTTKVFEAEKVKENTEVKTPNGTILVSTGNYIFTDKDGNKFGVSAEEVGVVYVEVSESKKTKTK